MDYKDAYETIQQLNHFINHSTDIHQTKNTSSFIFATKHWISNVHSYFKSNHGKYNDLLTDFNKSDILTTTNQSFTRKEYRKMLNDKVKYLKALQIKLEQEL